MGDFISDHQAPPTTCFSCTRLNRSTFKIVEDDKYHEYPFIYVKITEHVLVLIDTGCGGATDDKKVELTSLRRDVERAGAPDAAQWLMRGAGVLELPLFAHKLPL